MPIFEYTCNQCKNEFEKLVFSGEEKNIFCPKCQNKDVVKKMSASNFMGTRMEKCATSSPTGFS